MCFPSGVAACSVSVSGSKAKNKHQKSMQCARIPTENRYRDKQQLRDTILNAGNLQLLKSI
jgi:hypothetical protein